MAERKKNYGGEQEKWEEEDKLGGRGRKNGRRGRKMEEMKQNRRERKNKLGGRGRTNWEGEEEKIGERKKFGREEEKMVREEE